MNYSGQMKRGSLKYRFSITIPETSSVEDQVAIKKSEILKIVFQRSIADNYLF
jgi:hypothetical protein